MKRVAILILNYNGLEKLGNNFLKCIESAKNVKYNVDVYVIDNASTDKSKEVLQKYDINVISHKKNYGFVGGFNFAIEKISKKSMYDFLVLMNNDYIITNEECISEMVKYFNKNPRLISLQCINIKSNKKDISDVSGFMDIYFNGIKRYVGYKISEYPYKICYVTTNVGAFFMLDVKKLINLKRFPYVFDLSYYLDYEDIETGLFFWANGYYSAVLPIEGSIHLEEKTLQRSSPLRQYLISKNRVFCYRKLWNKKPFNFSLKVSLLRRILFEIKFKKKERIKGIFDGLRKSFTYTFNVKFYPLLITPQFKDILLYSYFMNQWLKHLGKISTAFITEKELKECNYPFLVGIRKLIKI